MSHSVVCSKVKESPTKGLVDINEGRLSSVRTAKQFTYEELEIATGKFSPESKIGEGGFGSVYKGMLSNGTLVAIKVLSYRSELCVPKFLEEIEALSGLEHENLVKLYGSCTEGGHIMMVYEYLENKSLAQTLLGEHSNKLQYSWKIRTQICIGVAQALAFLHEERNNRIVHGDIKTCNILLDKDLTPKISDIGLARLFPIFMTRINIRGPGTFGYLSPEYVFTGILSWKSDIYSFGILLLEIVCGRPIESTRLPAEEQNLLGRAWLMYKRGKLDRLVDEALQADSCTDKACKYLKIGLLCIQERAAKRPDMSVVAKMLKGEIDVDKMKMPKPSKLIMAHKSKMAKPSKLMVIHSLKSLASPLRSCF